MTIALLLASSCTRDVAPTTVLTSRGPRAPTSTELSAWSSSSSSSLASSHMRFDGRLQLLAVDVKGSVVAGASARVTSTWLVVGELAGRAKPSIVAAIAADGATLRATTTAPLATPATSTLTTLEWRPGDVVIASVDVAVPADVVGPARLWLGVLDSGRRWRARSRAGIAVVDDIAAVAVVDVAAGSAAAVVVDDGLPVVSAKRRKGSIVVDGVLDEADWQAAAVVTLGPYKVGAPAPTLATTVRLLWDDTSLYLAFDVDDDDPHSQYTNNDQPLYDSEALEIFIDADGDRDVYVELQAAPTDVRFDAAFAGGARKNMDVGFDVDVVVKHAARAGGYTQEWRIPIAGLKDVPAGEPTVGARWRINMFRLERRRHNDVVTSTEASAWSAVTANDFHALDRFGSLVFSD